MGITGLSGTWNGYVEGEIEQEKKPGLGPGVPTQAWRMKEREFEIRGRGNCLGWEGTQSQATGGVR
jgi:hypothetical protein